MPKRHVTLRLDSSVWSRSDGLPGPPVDDRRQRQTPRGHSFHPRVSAAAARIAAEYRRTTGTSLPISGEIAKHDACKHLELEPEKEGQGGFDAKDKDGHRIQIKGRAIFDESKGGQRLGQMKLEQEWDALAMVLMDENFETTEIYLANRDAIEDSIEEQGSSNRSKRGAMSVARFKIIGELVWDRVSGRQPGVWDNQAG